MTKVKEFLNSSKCAKILDFMFSGLCYTGMVVGMGIGAIAGFAIFTKLFK